MTDPFRREVFVQAADGTALFADDRGPCEGGPVAVVCIPGLTRNSRDFEPVFDLLGDSRRIVALDLRGRGRSAVAADPLTYTPAVELQDVLCVLDHLKIGRFALLGTSRGGIIGMLMAATAKERLAGLFLNDIGPELARAGLLRIAGYTGRPVSYASWDEAARGFAGGAVGFDTVPHALWLKVVQRIYVQREGRVAHNHDLALATTLPSVEAIANGTVPDLWPLVSALQGFPLTLLRGAGSDLLTREVALDFVSQIAGASLAEVPGRGHVPFLDEPESRTAILAWLDRVDAKEKGR